MSKLGRPKKNNARTSHVDTAVSEQEKEEIVREAERVDQTISQFIRRRLVDYPKLRMFAEEFVDLGIKLTRNWEEACRSENGKPEVWEDLMSDMFTLIENAKSVLQEEN